MPQELDGTGVGWHRNLDATEIWVPQKLGGTGVGCHRDLGATGIEWHRSWVAQELGATEIGWHLGVFLVAILPLTALWFTDLGGKGP